MTGLPLGIDVGGTKIAAALVDPSGHPSDARTAPTAGRGDEVITQIAAIIDGYRAQHPIHTVGLAVPGGVDPRTGIVTHAANVGWSNLDVVHRLHRLVPGLELRIDNDANAAAWAEHRFGGHPAGDSLALITVGTGLGGGIVLDNQLVRGSHGAGAEVGHLPVHPGGLACECGSFGCWEQYASARALQRAAVGAGWPGADTARDVLTAATAGDVTAAALVAHLADELASGIAMITAVLDPAQVLLGGGLGADPRFLPYVIRSMAAVTITAPRVAVPIRTATLGTQAGVIGAADLTRTRG